MINKNLKIYTFSHCNEILLPISCEINEYYFFRLSPCISNYHLHFTTLQNFYSPENCKITVIDTNKGEYSNFIDIISNNSGSFYFTNKIDFDTISKTITKKPKTYSQIKDEKNKAFLEDLFLYIESNKSTAYKKQKNDFYVNMIEMLEDEKNKIDILKIIECTKNQNTQ